MTRLYRKFFKAAFVAGLVSAGFVASHSPALAGPFGNASASLTGLFNPTVTSSTIDLSVGITALFSGNGDLPASTLITGTSAFNYSQTVNAVTPDVIVGLFSMADGAGGTIFFDLASVQTTAFVGGSSENIGLYLLGTLYDPFLGKTATGASVTMTLNDNNSGPFTFSATLSDPPAGVPEPMSLAVLGAGLIGLSLVRRRNV